MSSFALAYKGSGAGKGLQAVFRIRIIIIILIIIIYYADPDPGPNFSPFRSGSRVEGKNQVKFVNKLYHKSSIKLFFVILLF